MRAPDLRRGVGAFVAVLLAAVVVTAGVGVVSDAVGSNGATQPDAPAYDTGDLLPTPVDDGGSVPAPDAGTQKTVVVDAAHGNTVGRADMQPLVNALVESGHEVRFYTGGGSSSLISGSGTSALNETLNDADAFVIADPAAAYSGAEADAVSAFADNGGRVLLLGDTPTTATSASSLLGLTGETTAGSGQPNAVAARHGLAFNADYLYDMTENANNFQYVYGSPSADGGLAAGVDRTVFDAAVAVAHGDAATAAISAENVSRESTRTTGTYAVAVRSGNVAAIGDTWFLSPDGATVADNEALVGNVADFLVSGTKTGTIGGSSGSTVRPGGISLDGANAAGGSTNASNATNATSATA
ncbi:motility-associated ABC transporter substrate-binding family protein [Halarchaeum nitratireducens]|uniref:Uncharacterized protein n=1 Tax=Halarchaeum nitratireducens TaxID=489913 RepID=A0A830G851_9EURY|nr:MULTISPECIES: DUF4350 domain-containing protein [Halarchaeum]MBP2249878.1 hypothetical protein [Halarchaeum solikamskense]GGN10004.1 hypothetical protein GCM10009021_07160 [Halarchaeum nitratireducens]